MTDYCLCMINDYIVRKTYTTALTAVLAAGKILISSIWTIYTETCRPNASDKQVKNACNCWYAEVMFIYQFWNESPVVMLCNGHWWSYNFMFANMGNSSGWRGLRLLRKKTSRAYCVINFKVEKKVRLELTCFEDVPQH